MGFFEQLIDGGDTSYRNRLKNPYVWRQQVGNPQPWWYRTYTGTSTTGEIKPLAFVESKESYGHPVSFLGRTNRNIGGKFVHTKFTVDKPGEWMRLSRGNTAQATTLWRQSEGHIYPSGTMRTLITSPVTSYETALSKTTNALALASDLTLDASGTTAIARVAPTNPLVDLSTSLAELLREGLPQVPGSQGNLGGEYLNVMFGVLPLYGDLTDLRSVAKKADKLLSQYERDSGRWVRRRYDFPEDRDVTQAIQTNVVPSSGDNGGLVNAGTLVRQTTTSTKTWFEGAFTYYLPQKGWRRTVAELDYLYGVQPGVDTLYQLTAFSWLADYFFNMGDVVSNINSFTQDGLVLPYGYVMREQHVNVEETWSGNLWVDGSQQFRNITAEVSYVTHQRRIANPFGFGLSDDGLSSRQQSILVALGISRL